MMIAPSSEGSQSEALTELRTLVSIVNVPVNISYKKAFFSDQCKEIEENNIMGKTRDLFKKIRDNKGSFHPKDGHNPGQKWYGPNRSRRH